MSVRIALLCILFITAVGCKGQMSSGDSARTIANITFEEKQRLSVLNEVPAQTMAVGLPVFSFRAAAGKVTPGVVHIRTINSSSGIESDDNGKGDFWNRFFFDGGHVRTQGDASGVLVSDDGYIVTNNHVVQYAENIEVVLQNQKSFKAKVVGTDPETDLALLKIPESNLGFIEFGNSDSVEVGDWVLAVGNPFNLTSTVTSGIVSAKARNINLLKRKGAVESYIQTDAAMNPGNSGGALVDIHGKLVGINSAIATPTGAFAGYSFATPVNIVKKVIDDLLKKGRVERAYLGMLFKDMNGNESARLHTDLSAGVFVDSVLEGGAASAAGLKVNDIITAIDNRKITSSSHLHEIVEMHHPGETVLLNLWRDGKERQISLKLKEFDGLEPKSTPVILKSELFSSLGIKLEELTEKEKKKLRLPTGLKVVGLTKGMIYFYTNIRKGFIIVSVNGNPVNTEDEFAKAFEKVHGNVMLEGVYPGLNGILYYGFNME